MAVESVQEVQHLLASAAPLLAALIEAERRGREQRALEEEELAWLVAARARLERSEEATRTTLEDARALPELEALRAARAQAALDGWVGAIEALFAGIVRHASAGSPLVTVLFPHQKFEKLRRGGTSTRTYAKDFEHRRRSTYVARIAADPEYPFLPPLLASVDAAKRALDRELGAVPLSPEELEGLRSSVFRVGAELEICLRQARALAEAALARRTEWFLDLGFAAKSRRRAAADASVPPRSADSASAESASAASNLRADAASAESASAASNLRADSVPAESAGAASNLRANAGTSFTE